MPIYRTQARIDYPGDGGPGYNAFHFRTTNVPDSASQLEAATNALGAFYSRILNRLQGNAVVVIDGVWSGLGSAVGTGFDFPNQSLSVGGGTALPEFVSINLRWFSSVAGRRGRGRSFIGPLTQGVLAENGNLAPAVQSAVADAATEELIEPFDGNLNGAFGIYSRTNGTISDWVRAQVPAELASLTSRRD